MLIPFKDLFQKYNIKPNGILHLGANTGQEAKDYYDEGVNKVIWVEAIPSVFEQLKKNTKDYAGHFCINECVSDIDDNEVEFNISNNEAQSSSFLSLGVHKIAHPEVNYIDKIKMKTIRIDSMLGKYDLSIEGKWFLNADLQGAELLAFKGMGGLLNKFKWVYTELNSKYTYEGCALIDEVDAYLKDFNFHRVETAPWIGNCWTDGFYISY